MEQEVDVVIVGSGIAGCIMAKTLTQAGKRVLLLEAGLEAGISLDTTDSYNNYMYYLDTFYKAGIKVPNSPYPDIQNAPSINVFDAGGKIPPGGRTDQGYLVQMGPNAFASDYLRGPGGTTLHWLGSTPRMLPNDFEMHKNYGHGVNWPFSYDKLKRYYEMAEFEIGVSGDPKDQVDNIPNLTPEAYGKDYHFPMEMIPTSFLDQTVKELLKGDKGKVSYKGQTFKLNFVAMPQGRNSIPNKLYANRDIIWDRAKGKLKLQKEKVWNHKTKVWDKVSSKDKYEYLPIGALWDPNTGQRCEGNASCVPICPVQAKYNGLKSLRKADHRLLHIKTQAVASRVLFDKKKNVIGIEYKVYRYQNSIVYDTYVAKGKYYVLAASAIENAKIMLASDAVNKSKQLGCNLMDHMTVLTWGLLPKDKPGYPFRGPGSTTNIPTFRDGDFRKEHAGWIWPIDNWGWSWPTFAPGSDVDNAMTPSTTGDDRPPIYRNGLFGKALREELKSVLTRQVLLHAECEQEPYSKNRVTIDTKYRDPLGNYRPVIEYHVTEYMKKAFAAVKALSDEIFANAGIEDHTVYQSVKDNSTSVEYEGKVYQYWGAGHIVGTHRMGKSENDSVVNEDGRSWGHKNLYLIGCGNMPTLGTGNPTLTMTALTFKTAEALLKELDK